MHKTVIKLFFVVLAGMGAGALVFNASCGGATQHTVAQAAKDCALADIGQTAPEIGITVFDWVLQVLQGGKDGWKTVLARIGLQYGDDVLACAVKKVHDMLSSNMPRMLAASDPANDRAAEVIAEHGWTYK